MDQKWQIIRSDGSRLGPLTAWEIRDALRAGAIDPFDRVGVVGSKMSRPLVDVDEIFLAADARAKAKVDSVYEQPEAEELTRASAQSAAAVSGGWIPPNVVADPSATRKSNPQPVAVPKNRIEAMARNENLVKRNSAIYPKKNAKKYFLVDRQRRYHGPLSARDIQGLFYRGLVEKGSCVARDRNGNLLPVERFLQAYLGAKAGDFHSEQTRFRTSISRGLPSTKALEQRARELVQLQFFAKLKQKSRLFPLYVSIAFALFSLAVAIGYKSLQTSPKPKAISSDTLNQPIAITGGGDDAFDSETVDSDSPAREEIRQQNSSIKQASKQKPKAKKRDRGTKQSSTVARPRPLPPTQYAVTRLPPTRAPAAFVVGAQFSSKGSFPMASLQRCPAKCLLSFRSRTGQLVELMFFRDGYKVELERTKGFAFVKGRVAATSPTLRVYLEEVSAASP